MIVWLASYPRSGNTLARLVLKHLGLGPTFSVYDDPALHRLSLVDLVGHGKMTSSRKDLERDQGFHFVKTHEYPPDDDNPAIYIVRDGRGAMLSLTHYMREIESQNGSFSGNLRDILNGHCQFGYWGDHVSAWLSRQPKPVLIQFERLIEHPVETVISALQELSIPLPDSAGLSNEAFRFSKLQEIQPVFFRSGKVGGWEDDYSEELLRLFWRNHRVGMRTAGYSFDAPNQFLSKQDIPTVTLDDLGIPLKHWEPIKDDICMPPYHGPEENTDFDVLISLANHIKPNHVFEFGTAAGNTVANLCRYTEATVTTLNAAAANTSGIHRTYDIEENQIGHVYRAHGYDSRVHQIVADSLFVSPEELYPDRVFDLVIIDACHDYEYVLNDFLMIVDRVRSGGWVVFHDCAPGHGGHVRQVWDACSSLRCAGFDIKHVSNSWWGIWQKSAGTSPADATQLCLLDRIVEQQRDKVEKVTTLEKKLNQVRRIPGYRLFGSIFGALRKD